MATASRTTPTGMPRRPERPPRARRGWRRSSGRWWEARNARAIASSGRRRKRIRARAPLTGTRVSRCSPKTPRSRSAISPTVAQARHGVDRSPARGCRRPAPAPRARRGRPATGPASRRARSARTPLHLGPLEPGIDAQEVQGRLVALLLEPVHAHDHALPGLDLPLEAIGRLLDLALDLAALDRARARRPLASMRVEQASASASRRVGRRLHGVGPAERVHRVGDPRLVGDHLLRAQGQPGRGLGGQGQRLVLAVRVQALAAAEHGGQGLQRDPHHVVVGLLRGEGDAARLHVEAQLLGLRVRRRRTAPS